MSLNHIYIFISPLLPALAPTCPAGLFVLSVSESNRNKRLGTSEIHLNHLSAYSTIWSQVSFKGKFLLQPIVAIAAGDFSVFVHHVICVEESDKLIPVAQNSGLPVEFQIALNRHSLLFRAFHDVEGFVVG